MREKEYSPFTKLLALLIIAATIMFCVVTCSNLMLELEDGRRLRFYEFTRYGSYLTEKAEDQPGRPG